tara:strand:- start:870 stop:1352 length:483 start_codon:yes stop_codon:yes gene_type:complete
MKRIITVLLILSASLLEAQHLNLSQSNEGENLCWILIKPDMVGLAANEGWLTKKEIEKEDYLLLSKIIRQEIKRRIDQLPVEQVSASKAPNCSLHIFAGSTHTSHDWKGRISEVTAVVDEVRRFVGDEDMERFLEIVNTEPVDTDNPYNPPKNSENQLDD